MKPFRASFDVRRVQSVESIRRDSDPIGFDRTRSIFTSNVCEIDAAEDRYHEAIDVARSQFAKSWELRAATRLTRLWHSQGKTTEARDLLAPIYGWFTEGFDSTDLKEAKALLDDLI